MSQHKKGNRSRWVRTATRMAILIAFILCALKAIAWFITGSTAVLGSLADSSIDLVTSIMAAVAASYAATAPDSQHKFGHHKAEALFALTQVVLLSASASLVMWESVQQLYAPVPLTQPHLAIGVLIFSIVATLFLVLFQTYALNKTDSLIIRSDRAHYSGDLVALVGALFAVTLGEYLGMPRLDAVAGLAMGVVLVHAAWQVVRQAIPQLMDEELPDKDKVRIKQLLDKHPEVLSYHALRTRKAGGKRFIQLDLQLDAELTFRQAHKITDEVELMLENAFSDVDVIIHADPAGEARPERRVVEDTENYE